MILCRGLALLGYRVPGSRVYFPVVVAARAHFVVCSARFRLGSVAAVAATSQKKQKSPPMAALGSKCEVGAIGARFGPPKVLAVTGPPDNHAAVCFKLINSCPPFHARVERAGQAHALSSEPIGSATLHRHEPQATACAPEKPPRWMNRTKAPPKPAAVPRPGKREVREKLQLCAGGCGTA